MKVFNEPRVYITAKANDSAISKGGDCDISYGGISTAKKTWKQLERENASKLSVTDPKHYPKGL